MKESDLISNYENLSLKKLDETIRKSGFVYKLIMRTSQKCIYAQWEGGITIAYEVFKNRIREYRKMKMSWASKKNEQVNPEDFEEYFEVFPSDEEFGKRAWTYPTLEKALAAYEALDLS